MLTHIHARNIAGFLLILVLAFLLTGSPTAVIAKSANASGMNEIKGEDTMNTPQEASTSEEAKSEESQPQENQEEKSEEASVTTEGETTEETPEEATTEDNKDDADKKAGNKESEWRPVPMEVITEAASATGIPVASLSLDYNPAHVVSPRFSTSRSKNITTWYLSYTRSEDIMKTLSSIYESEISAGDLRITDNPTSNAIIVRSKEPDEPLVKDVIDIIQSLDFRPGQVLIDVLVVELKVNDKDLFDLELKALGRNPFNVSQTLGTVGLDHGKIDQADPGAISSGFKALITSQNKFKLFLNAAKSKDKANIISSPHIVAANHRKATFKIGDKVPIISSVRPSDAGPIKTFDIKEIGIELAVTPHINRSGEIDLEILQTINNLSSYNEAEGTAQMTNREVETNITVANGETLILGGFIEEKKSVIESRIPLLSNIPGIGKAFRKKDNKEDKTEMLVFITPRILETVQEARKATENQAAKTTFKDKVAGLLKDRGFRPGNLAAGQEILIDRHARDWKYDFNTTQAEVLVWQVPPELNLEKLVLKRYGSCPFGFGASKRLQPPFIRTQLQPSDGFVFLKEFFLESPESFQNLTLHVASNNAASVYINGKLVDEDPAMKLRDGHDYEYWNRTRSDIPGTALVAGTNTVVVLLASDKTTNGSFFDMMLIGNRKK